LLARILTPNGAVNARYERSAFVREFAIALSAIVVFAAAAIAAYFAWERTYVDARLQESEAARLERARDTVGREFESVRGALV
jgi:hypothetical protein